MATLIVYPDANPESNSVDGRVNQSDSGASWASLRAGAGTGASDIDSPTWFADINGIEDPNEYGDLYRSIFLYYTAALTAAATITAAVKSVCGTAKTTTAGKSPTLNVYSSAPASNTALAAGDFDSLGTTPFCDTAITYAAFDIGGTIYNNWALNPAGRAAVSKTITPTKLALREATYDVANVDPGLNNSNNSVSFSGKFAETAGTTADPKLTITYTVPAASAIATSQAHYRFFEDDGTINAGTATAAEDASITSDRGVTKRLRIDVRAGGDAGPSTNIARQLQWRPGTGNWVSVAADTSSQVYLFDSAQFINGAATTQRLTANGQTLIAGQGKDLAGATSQITLGTTNKVEDEWALRLGASAVAQQTYNFRTVFSDGSLLNAYPVTPQWQVIPTISTSQKHHRFFQDDGSINAATAAAAEDGNITSDRLATSRLRIGVYGGGGSGASTNLTRLLQWRPSGGNWISVQADTSSQIILFDSTQFTNGVATTERLSADGLTFLAGQGKDLVGATSQVVLGTTNKVEDEWSLQLGANAVANETYQFREVFGDGSLLQSYDVTPQWQAIVPSITTSQGHYRFFGDGAGLNVASGIAAEDAAISTIRLNARRLRVGIYADGIGLASTNLARTLQWRASGGNWVSVDADTSKAIHLLDSPQFADADATTERLTTGGLTFLAGQGKDTGAAASVVTLWTTNKIEDEWSLRMGLGAVVGTDYQFRVVFADGSLLNTYGITPTWTADPDLRTSTALTSLRLAVENSFGVSKASPQWLYPWVTAEDIIPDTMSITPRHLTGDKFVRRPVVGGFQSVGRLSTIVGPENFHKIMHGLLANITTLNPTTNVYGHTYSAASSQATMEIQAQKREVEIWWRGVLARSVEFTIAPDTLLIANLDLLAQSQEILTAGTMPTPTLSTLLPFTHSKGSVERDDGAVLDCEGFTLRLTANPITFKRFGSLFISDVVFGKQEVQWEFQLAFADDVEFRRFFGSSTGSGNQAMASRYQSVKVEWLFETPDTLATGYNYSLKFTAYGAVYGAFPQGIPSDNELLRARPTALVRRDPTAGVDLEIWMQNTLTNAAVIT